MILFQKNDTNVHSHRDFLLTRTMDATTVFLADIDVVLANMTTTTVPSSALRTQIKKFAMRHEPDMIATKRVWSLIRDQSSDAVHVDNLRRQLANCAYRNGTMVTHRRCDTNIPRGFVMPRYKVGADTGNKNAGNKNAGNSWIRHPSLGWLHPADRQYIRRHRRTGTKSSASRSSASRSSRPRYGVLFCLCILILLLLLFIRKRNRLAHKISSYQSLDQEFIDALPPTSLNFETPCPNTSDLVRDFNDFAKIQSASSPIRRY